MSREKCNQAKIFYKPSAETAMDDSDCRDQSKHLCRHFAGKANSGRVNPATNHRIRAVPTLEKPTTEWVERQFEAPGSHSIQDILSS